MSEFKKPGFEFTDVEFSRSKKTKSNVEPVPPKSWSRFFKSGLESVYGRRPESKSNTSPEYLKTFASQMYSEGIALGCVIKDGKKCPAVKYPDGKIVETAHFDASVNGGLDISNWMPKEEQWSDF